MYESPIRLLVQQLETSIREQQDKQIFEAIQKFGVDVDRDELIKALAYDSDQYDKGYADGRADAQRWVRVEDEQKPKHHDEVLCRYVFDGDSECFYAVLTYYAYGDNGYVTGQHFTGEGLHDMRVTHWMPLPEPPKEECK